MKNIICSFLLLGLTTAAFAQDGQSSDKKVQAGITYQVGLNYNKPGTKVIQRNGVGAVNSIGLVLNFPFTANIALATGLEFDFDSFKYDVSSTSPIYYNYTDSEILQKKDDHTGSTLYNLVERKQKAIYGTIPTMLLFRTNPIGDFRYYGKFGARTSFLLSNSIFDQGFNLTGDSITGVPVAQRNDNMKASGDMFFIRSTIGISGGAEWNFTGTTSIYAEIGFHFGVTPIHNGNAVGGDDKDRNKTMFTDKAGTAEYLNFSAKQKQILLKVGILF